MRLQSSYSRLELLLLSLDLIFQSIYLDLQPRLGPSLHGANVREEEERYNGGDRGRHDLIEGHMNTVRIHVNDTNG